MRNFSSFPTMAKACIWLIVFLMVVPPPLMAQNIGTPGFPLPGVGVPGFKELVPGAPIVTNPTALQPLAPPLTPCPPAPARTPQPITPGGPTLNDFWPAESSAVLPPSADIRIRQERDARFKQEREEQLKEERAELLRPERAEQLKQEREKGFKQEQDRGLKQEREERAELEKAKQ